MRLCRPDARWVERAEAEQRIATRIAEADEFYASITPSATTPDEAAVMRQALAGMLFTCDTRGNLVYAASPR